jgi:hypothetical protein
VVLTAQVADGFKLTGEGTLDLDLLAAPGFFGLAGGLSAVGIATSGLDATGTTVAVTDPSATALRLSGTAAVLNYLFSIPGAVLFYADSASASSLDVRLKQRGDTVSIALPAFASQATVIVSGPQLSPPMSFRIEPGQSQALAFASDPISYTGPAADELALTVGSAHGVLSATASGSVTVETASNGTLTLKGTTANLNTFLRAGQLRLQASASTTVSFSIKGKAAKGRQPEHLVPKEQKQAWWDLSQRLLGKKRCISKHPGGVVVFDQPPAKSLILKKDNQILLDKYEVEDLALLKVDVLSNRGLSVLWDCGQRGPFDYNTECDATLGLLARGDSLGIVQGESPVNTWDYQWHFTCIANGGLTIIPNRNLVTNIGFDEAGVHCSGKTPDPGLGEGFSELVHPQFVLPDSAADRYMFDTLFGGNSIRQQRHFASRLRNRFRSWRTRWLSFFSLKSI